jgi:hypothetical protein
MSHKSEKITRSSGVDPVCDLHFPTEGFEKSVARPRSEWLCRAGWTLWSPDGSQIVFANWPIEGLANDTLWLQR